MKYKVFLFYVTALLAWQLLRFINGHFRYCCRLGLIDNTLLGLAKPKQQKSVFEYRTLPRECYLYMIHSIGIAAVGIVCVPIQVNTFIYLFLINFNYLFIKLIIGLLLFQSKYGLHNIYLG